MLLLRFKVDAVHDWLAGWLWVEDCGDKEKNFVNNE
jgi:hypothetical protein